MKSLKYIIPLVALTAVSCQQPSDSGDLKTLREERDSLATLNGTIQERLLEIDQRIAELDSTTNYTTVSTHKVGADNFEHFFQVYGSVEADQNVTLYAESAGMIERISVREGQSVSKGQALLNLDDDVIRNNIQEVETSLSLAKTLYEKQERLWQQNIGSEVAYLEAKNRYEGLQTTKATLEAQLAMSNLKAPFSGVVDEIFPKVGEYAAPGMPLIRLVNVSQVYVTADVPESYVNRVKTGEDVTLYFRSIQDTVVASIIQVGQFINPDNRTFKIKVGISRTSGAYKPNMMASVRIRDYAADSTVVLPSHLIQQNQEGKSYVYVLSTDDAGLGDVKRQFVQLGLSYQGMTEIRGGLEAGNLIVDRGARSVQDGERVRIVED
ncbi:efflux RND transporter periplasmic adaptor subunit [Phaeocystidibacter luteus]|uniref:Efflux RND transporter periplasmic adaptor subunit n=1 Tax=Phaeocystidibacter luteus TaxID=911197 RepID=A0A6N6RES8_9FLAO|nr:efflux RND transporter periplasmic adaptor subunit [Phaeocystidibacter luteus]KAB2808680.1 efflux RND transporter periplasmic adaptor subunit [Phaeocystidibacter luteus]